MKPIEKSGIVVFIAGACMLSIVYGFTVGNAIALYFGAILITVGVSYRASETFGMIFVGGGDNVKCLVLVCLYTKSFLFCTNY